MLTSELIRPRLRFSGSSLSVEMVDEQDVALQQTAQELIDLLHRHVGCSLEKWEEALAAYEGARVDYVVVRGLAKVLADAAMFTPLVTPFAPAMLRERLFVHGPVFTTPQLFHPQARYDVVQGVADELGISSEQVETTLFADRPATYLLTDAGPEWKPAGLLARYNLELARVRPPQATGEMSYQLDSTSSLRSFFKSSGLFDSRLEADFAGEFEQKMGNKRGHWQLTRESEVLLLGDTVMIPDFILTDDQDEKRKIMIELVGFWHPQYLRRKIEKVRAANCASLLLLVYKGLNVTEEAFQEAASEVIFFQNKPVLKEVMETVEEMAERVYGPRVKRKRTRSPRRTAHPE